MNCNILKTSRAAIIGITARIAMTGSMAVHADGGAPFGGLAGNVFVAHAEVVASLDPGFPVGTTFDNCYFFEEDGTWVDPLYPDPSFVVPGVWVQHTELPIIRVPEPDLGYGSRRGQLRILAHRRRRLHGESRWRWQKNNPARAGLCISVSTSSPRGDDRHF